MFVRYWAFSLHPYGNICPPCAWVEGYEGEKPQAFPALVNEPYLCRRCGKLEWPAPERVRQASESPKTPPPLP